MGHTRIGRRRKTTHELHPRVPVVETRAAHGREHPLYHLLRTRSCCALNRHIRIRGIRYGIVHRTWTKIYRKFLLLSFLPVS